MQEEVTRAHALELLRQEDYIGVYRYVFGDSWASGLARCIPEHMWGGMVRWVVFGIIPGSFQQAVISNDLKGAARSADDINARRLYDYCMFMYNYAPSQAFGSPKVLDEWRGVLPAPAETSLG